MSAKGYPMLAASQTLSLVLHVGFLLTAIPVKRWVGALQPYTEQTLCPLEAYIFMDIQI